MCTNQFFKTAIFVVAVFSIFSLAVYLSPVSFAEDTVGQVSDTVIVSEQLSVSGDNVLTENAVVVEAPVVVEETSDVVEELAVQDEALSVEESVAQEEIVVVEESPVVEEVVVEEVFSNSDVSVSESVVDLASASVSVSAPMLTTDKDDYHPGEIATIFGRFFQSLQSIVLKIFGSDENDNNYTESSLTIEADDSGSFTTSYTLDDLYRPFYKMTASSLSGTLLAEGFFRDSSIGIYDQCSNDDGDGYATGDQGCRWINGNLNANNSTYQEGDSTPQRLWLKGYAPGSIHTVTLQYGTTKSGKHAYDFLTSWNQSESWSTLADRCDDITGCTSASETVLAIPHDPNGSGEFESTISASLRNFIMRGGTLNSATAPVIYSGSYTGTSETNITITFTVASSGSMCSTKQGVTSCDVALFFGAHISKASDWQPFNGTTGATSISGSPYHVALFHEDGASIGSRDNQMQANAIVLPSGAISGVKFYDLDADGVKDPSDTPLAGWLITLNPGSVSTTTNGSGIYSFAGLIDGTYSVCETFQSGWTQTYPTTDLGSCPDGNGYSVVVSNGSVASNIDFGNTQIGHIVVDKVTNPSGDLQSFSFDAVGGSYVDFSLTDVTAPNDQALSAGTYSVSETVPAGWSQTSVNCVSSLGDTEVASALELDSGEIITCTFTNTKKGYIIVQKNAVPDDSQEFTFTNNFGNGNPASFGLIDDSTTGLPNFNAEVLPGTYSVSENALTGWQLESAICSDGSPVSAVAVTAGETVTCTFTNEKLATVILVKNTLGGNGTFDFDATGVGLPTDIDLTTVGGDCAAVIY